MIERVGLPTACPELGLDPTAVRRAMGSDTKAQASRLHLVLLRALGDPLVADGIPETLIRQAIEEMVC